MKVTRTLLLDDRDDDQETQGVKIKYRDLPVSGSYVSDIKNNLQNIALSRRERSIINPVQIEAIDPTDPTTYKETDAVEADRPNTEETSLIPGISSSGGESNVSSSSPVKRSGGRGGNALLNRVKNLEKYRGVESDNLKYGDTFPDGAIGIGSKSTDDFTDRYLSTAGDFLKSFSNNLSVAQNKKTYEQNRLKQGEKFADRGEREAVNLSNYKDNREKQRNIRAQSRLSDAVKATGIPTKPKAGSFGISKKGRDQAAINRGIAAAKKTGIPTKPPAGSFGISKKGREQAAKNRAAAQAAKAKKTAESKRAAAAAAKAKAEGKTKAQQAAAARNAAGSNRTMSAGQQTRSQAGSSARTAAGNRARVKSNARKRAQAAAKKRRACDIRIKIDMTSLKNMNLHRDELADVAYFVKELQEIN